MERKKQRITVGAIIQIPLEDNLKKENLPPMFRQSTLKPERIELVYFDRFEKATPEQCTGLERWAVWNLEGIEQRLNDFYENKENFYEKVDKEIVAN